MKASTVFLLAGVLCTGSTMAAAEISAEAVALESGLSVREICIAFGPATAYPEYRGAYSGIVDKVRNALGPERFAELAGIISP